MLPNAGHIDYAMWKAMGRPQSPLTFFERVMKAGHDPKFYGKHRCEIRVFYRWRPNPSVDLAEFAEAHDPNRTHSQSR